MKDYIPSLKKNVRFPIKVLATYMTNIPFARAKVKAKTRYKSG